MPAEMIESESKLKRFIDKARFQGMALYYAYKDSDTPWYAKTVAALVVIQIFNPIDLIPDFIPVLGYLDDLVLIPFGIWLAWKLIPEVVRQRSQISARDYIVTNPGIPTIYKVVTVGVAVLFIAIVIWLIILLFGGRTK